MVNDTWTERKTKCPNRSVEMFGQCDERIIECIPRNNLLIGSVKSSLKASQTSQMVHWMREKVAHMLKRHLIIVEISFHIICIMSIVRV